jgi:hypothetical protein
MIKNFLISLLTILAFAMPSYAAAPSVKKQAKDGDSSVDFGMMTVDFVTSNTAGVYSLGFSYPLFSLDWSNGAGGFAAELHVCDTPNGGGGGDLSASGECTLVTALATTDLTVESFKSKKRYIVIEITTAGTGKLTIKGSWDQISDAGDTLQGVAPDSSSENVTGLTNILPNSNPDLLINTTIVSPKWVVGTKNEGRYNIDGIKAYCTGAGLGVDTNKPWFTCPSAGTLKTKTGSLFIDHTNLTPSEAHPLVVNLFTGGDTDPNAASISVYASGGSQTGGDEGINGIRLTTIPNWGAAYGTATVPVTTGSYVDVSLGGISNDESKFVGVGKLLVLSGSSRVETAYDGTTTTRPPGTRLDNNFASGGYGGHTSNLYNWSIDSGTGPLPAKITADNWCVSDSANDYYIPGTATFGKFWLQIKAIEPVSRETFATHWYGQSADYRYPAGIRWSGDYTFAPCYTVTKITEQAGATQYETTGINIYKTDADAATAETDVAIEITPYGEWTATGIKTIQSARIPVNTDGFVATSSLVQDTTNTSVGGYFQLRDAFKAEYSGGCLSAVDASSCLVDKKYAGWETGLKIPAGGAGIGMDYAYFNHHIGSGASMFQLRPPATFGNWSGFYDAVVMKVYGYGGFNLRLHGTRGWGVGSATGKFFPLISAATVDDNNASTTDGAILEWDATNDVYKEKALVTADPCSGKDEGYFFYNDTSDYYCFCDGTGADVQMHSPATACF